jgi:hypothetical protein
MATQLKAQPKFYVEAECPAAQSLLRLRFDLGGPHVVKVALAFPASGWNWSEEMGLIMGGTHVAEVELPGLPSGAFVMTAKLFDPQDVYFSGQPLVVSSHGVRRPQPYLFS